MAEETNAVATEEPVQAQKPGMKERVLSKMLVGKPKNGNQEKKPVTWRHALPHEVNHEINHLVKETHKHRDAYKRTLKARDAQLWVAVAHMNKRLKNIENQLGIKAEV